MVGNETNPPLVQSLSYGDQEVSVFPTNNSAAFDYGMRCEMEFMLLGLRGVSILVSSGDDGIASSTIRNNPTGSCSQAWPEWPASSPYVTSVGATQLTNAYLPVCQQPYASSIYSAGSGSAIQRNELLVQCSGVGETVCSSTIGGVITSGGGFSNVFNREELVSGYGRYVYVCVYISLHQILYIYIIHTLTQPYTTTTTIYPNPTLYPILYRPRGK